MLKLETYKSLFLGCLLYKTHAYYRKEFIDKWGTSFVIGDDVVVRLYYQGWGSNDRSFALLKYNHVVYMLCNVVYVAKFIMPPIDHIVSGNDGVCGMSEDTLSGILSQPHFGQV